MASSTVATSLAVLLACTLALPLAAADDNGAATAPSAATPATAEAAPPEPSAQDAEAAKALFKKATAHFQRERFADALAGFSEAYAKDPRPGFLFNIAQCHRQLGDHTNAVKFFERYLQEAPNAPNRAAAADMLEDEKLMAGATEPAPPPVTATAAPPESVAPVQPASEEPLYNRPAFWGIVGGAAAAAVVGTVVVVAVSGNRSLGVVDLRGAR
jgi:tetratricopeptide (TPR) repeat protein